MDGPDYWKWEQIWSFWDDDLREWSSVCESTVIQSDWSVWDIATPPFFLHFLTYPSHSNARKKNSNPILLFQQQTRPTSSIFPILVFFFFFFFVIVICYKFKSMQNDWEAKNKNREKRIMRNRDGEEVTLWVWVWTIQSHSYYGCCSENHWVWLLFGIAGTTLSLSLSLSCFLPPLSLSLFLSWKATEIFCIYETKKGAS